ncbi:MAG: GNAT family N-acetyltransferase [Mizugakiibacter sp.]|uniref:GNAT family N-acetyltransferase n=1 Tax=Mizugakiibacter sp. TaxID=1972610 RepID=UPI0031C34FB9|nr:GNAT family N-acetyltransferase [Xanthomonadaceae bacterium]
MTSPHPLPGSARLALRRFTVADRALLYRLHRDPRVMRFAGGVLDRAASEAMLHERILDYYAQHPGLGVWATLERASGACVGLHLLNHIRGEAHIQVGYLLFPEYWGRGYATEMASAVLRYGFAALGLAQIVAITDRANADSQHVLLKIGLQHRGERSLTHPAYAKQGPLAWFERDAADWLAERDPHTAAARP